MSFRVERVEPTGSSKSSTEKQRDPYQLWRAKIAQQAPGDQSPQKKSFRDVLISTVEANQASEKEEI